MTFYQTRDFSHGRKREMREGSKGGSGMQSPPAYGAASASTCHDYQWHYIKFYGYMILTMMFVAYHDDNGILGD